MTKRGKILRDTNAGPGLLFVDGRQHTFNLEGVWKSDVAPTVGMVVDVEFGDNDVILSIRAVAESQLAKEQAEIALNAAKEKASRLTSNAVAKFGIGTIVAVAALVIGWMFLDTISIQISSAYRANLSFWNILSVLNSGADVMSALGARNGGTGMYGVMGGVALLAPLAPYFSKDARAHLGGLAPLFFMIFVFVTIGIGISDGVRQMHDVAGALGGDSAQKVADDMTGKFLMGVMKAISIGAGAFLSSAASLYFAGKGVIKFLASRA